VKKVLFLCIGNSCRSQMAEGFARKYGTDVMEALSAGLAPAGIVQPLTKKVMEAKNIRLEGHFPKDLATIDTRGIDLIVNMSGTRISGRLAPELRDWDVEDPIGAKEDVYIAVRDRIEMLVMHLILELRRGGRRRA
jgi:arsenate reductase